MDVIDALVSGQHSNGNGDLLSVPTRSIVIEPDLSGTEVEAIRALGLPAPIAIVSDPDTHRVLGHRIEEALKATGETIPVHMEKHPHADSDTGDKILTMVTDARSLVAVGSGTINDLCKYVAWKKGIDFAVFATAPSMNGYTSVNAAITVEGHKKSLQAVAPVGVFMDLQVLSEAPERMIQSGLGDSACRATVQADWLMAHILHGSDYDATPFDMLLPEEGALLGNAGALLDGDLSIMSRLARTLTLSGMGMTICGGSHPASQGEHLIGHYLEMCAPPGTPPAFHGEQIGVATLVMARLQERMLSSQCPQVTPTRVSENDILDHFGAAVGPACWREFEHKVLDDKKASGLNARLAECWPEIQSRVSQVTLPSSSIETALKSVGAPTTYAELGLSREFFTEAVYYARTIRNRYTFLDLAAESGMLNPDELI